MSSSICIKIRDLEKIVKDSLLEVLVDTNLDVDLAGIVITQTEDGEIIYKVIT